jgi:hypothetical protein
VSDRSQRAGLLLPALCVCATLACLLGPRPVQAQGEGPRAFELVPEGSQAVNVYGVFGRGNQSFNPGSVVPGIEVDVNGSIIEYARAFALANRLGSVILSLPVGDAVASVHTATNGVSTYTRSGIGDLQLTGTFGLVGSPALPEKDYEAYRPGFALSLLTRVYVRTGAYDRTAPVNLGDNRRAVQLGLPLAYYIGDSFLDRALTTFELVPSVTWYSDNNEPARGDHSSEAPLLQLEGHITRNLNPALWISLDAIFLRGAETTTDGVSDHNEQRSFALGLSASVAVSDTMAATLSYTDEVSRNGNSAKGHVIRLLAEFSL